MSAKKDVKLVEAERLLKKLKFAYENLEEDIRLTEKTINKAKNDGCGPEDSLSEEYVKDLEIFFDNVYGCLTNITKNKKFLEISDN